MSDYTLEWGVGGTTADGDNVLGGADGDVTVTVETPENSGGEDFEIQNNAQDGVSGPTVLGAFYPDRPTDDDTVININFDQAVENVTFDLYDVDSGTGDGTGGWDDQITIIATLDDGSEVTITFDSAGNQLVNGNSIQGNGTATPRSDTVNVTIDGPIDSIQIIYNNGNEHESVGYVGIGDISFDVAEPPCFVRGTMIDTNRGEVAIENLLTGDLVRTADNGFQPIRWIGATTVSGLGKLAPICIQKGSIGNTQDLLVSPAHRILICGWQAELLFGQSEILTSAKSLINDKSITTHICDKVEYFHLLFDRHEIIFSNGAASESFHPVEASIGAMSYQSRQEILELFPELATSTTSYGPSARQTALPHEMVLLS